MTQRKIKAYHLQPVYESLPTDPPMMATAALMTCMVTGEVLDSMGGGGEYLAPGVVEALRNDGNVKVIVNALVAERNR